MAQSNTTYPDYKIALVGLFLICLSTLFGILGVLLIQRYPFSIESASLGIFLMFLCSVCIIIAGGFFTYWWILFFQHFLKKQPSPRSRWRQPFLRSHREKREQFLCTECGQPASHIVDGYLFCDDHVKWDEAKIEPMIEPIIDGPTCEVCGHPAHKQLLGRWLCKDHLGHVW